MCLSRVYTCTSCVYTHATRMPMLIKVWWIYSFCWGKWWKAGITMLVLWPWLEGAVVGQVLLLLHILRQLDHLGRAFKSDVANATFTPSLTVPPVIFCVRKLHFNVLNLSHLSGYLLKLVVLLGAYITCLTHAKMLSCITYVFVLIIFRQKNMVVDYCECDWCYSFRNWSDILDCYGSSYVQSSKWK